MIKFIHNMNKYTVFGIFVIALGTLLITGLFKHPILTVLGVIINAIGLLVMTIGSSISDKKDKSEIIEKISIFKEEINKIKKSSTNEEALNSVKKVENEFNEWAEEFVGNLESKSIKRQKDEILLKETEIDVSNKWRYIYQYVFEVIRQMLEAYNEKANKKIEFTIPALPINLFGEDAEALKCLIIFNENKVWRIGLGKVSPHKREKYTPTIDIRFFIGDKAIDHSQYNSSDSSSIFLHLDIEDEKISVNTLFLNILIGKLKNTYSIKANEYKESIKELFITLIEYELSNLKH